ncbi:PQQ-dependent sugar dehydrogenase [Halorarius halobius]|uniref:PQQ-dependent sugar dehydrogenase n=1 Tax=Halorarius halobius TaxID=2962671 RepID=UPI0020CF1935|nr:PQQ-dependent sugar dehydrogenase [Halorarius halobius]
MGRRLPGRDGVSHRAGGRVVRVVDGAVEPVADLSGEVATGGEGGLLGLVFHPNEPTAFTYQTYIDVGSRQNRVVAHDLSDGWASRTVFDGIPGASIHDGGRLLAWNDALYVTSGDAGDADSAQDRDALSGKVHRLTFGGDPHPDNPFGTSVFTWGHRNPQGLAPRDGRLFSTEHGPDSDDEINLLEAGNNYGWPELQGTRGGERYTPALDSFTPTIAPGGATFYPNDGPIDAWQGDLLFGTLAGSHLHRTTIEGTTVTGNDRHFEGTFGRLRTTFVGPDDHLYAVTSNRDGRGSPQEGDDRVLRFAPA